MAAGSTLVVDSRGQFTGNHRRRLYVDIAPLGVIDPPSVHLQNTGTPVPSPATACAAVALAAAQRPPKVQVFPPSQQAPQASNQAPTRGFGVGAFRSDANSTRLLATDPVDAPASSASSVAAPQPNAELDGQPERSCRSPWCPGANFPDGSACNLYHEFSAAKSCVVRFFNLPSSPQFLLSAFFARSKTPKPLAVWARQDGPMNSVWAVFASHSQAAAALHLSGSSVSVAPAHLQDLDNVDGLRRIHLPPVPQDLKKGAPSAAVAHSTSAPPSTNFHDMSASFGDTDVHIGSGPSYTGRVGLGSGMTSYNLSSNPPNPKNSFRAGDWICASPVCAAHNFGRNSTCIVCRLPRGGQGLQTDSQVAYSGLGAPRLPTSPRFAGPPASFTVGSTACFKYGLPSPLSPYSPSVSSQTVTAPVRSASGPPSPSYPLLTPSGRTFAKGGKVQNVSSNPLAPCVMYWPDNEPLPEPGQIRPACTANASHPPILNTGNRGPIEHQPGDWICQKCNYLNWRRRKVCQTCFPYAEGNGDSISAAVQSERIALLANALSKQSLADVPLMSPPVGGTSQPSASRAPVRSYSMTPPQISHRSSADSALARAHSQLNLGAQYAASHPVHMRPIYQTGGPTPSLPPSPTSSDRAFPPSPSSSGESVFLPACLQDVVASPSLSPSSTGELSLEDEFEAHPPSPARRAFYGVAPRLANGSSSSLVSSRGPTLGSIWGLDGDERKAFSQVPTTRRSSPDAVSRFPF